ncbi:MAG: hypothetical protein LBJ90_08825 [Treponema sp.]|jgi:hypothetical protein|nr:hypothetical protein [Treponema sp.]
MMKNIIGYTGKSAGLFGSLVFLGLVLSCASAPGIPDPVLGGGEFIPLEPGALAYLFIDVPGAAPALKDILPPELGDRRIKRMFERTKTAVAALYPAESGRRYQFVSWGSYPGSAGMALNFSREWKKQRSVTGAVYRFSPASRISLALNTRQVYGAFSRSENPCDPFTLSGALTPPDFNEFRRGALLSCWLEKPGDTISRLFEAMELPLRIPAERMYVSLFPFAETEEAPSAPGTSGGTEGGGEPRYEALLRIETREPSQARALATLISMTRIFASDFSGGEGFSALAAVFFANPPVQDGSRLNIKTAPLRGREIALLFSLFSVYSQSDSI